MYYHLFGKLCSITLRGELTPELALEAGAKVVPKGFAGTFIFKRGNKSCTVTLTVHGTFTCSGVRPCLPEDVSA